MSQPSGQQHQACQGTKSGQPGCADPYSEGQQQTAVYAAQLTKVTVQLTAKY